MEKVYGSILIGKSTSPITTLQDPSKSFTIKALGFIATPSNVSFIKVVFGITFNEDHVSTNTLDNIVSKNFIESIELYYVLSLPMVIHNH